MADWTLYAVLLFSHIANGTPAVCAQLDQLYWGSTGDILCNIAGPSHHSDSKSYYVLLCARARTHIVGGLQDAHGSCKMSMRGLHVACCCLFLSWYSWCSCFVQNCSYMWLSTMKECQEDDQGGAGTPGVGKSHDSFMYCLPKGVGNKWRGAGWIPILGQLALSSG